MSAGAPEVLFFCLGTGAVLGCLFLLFRVLGILLRAGKLLTGLLDILFCCLCGAAVFLCALAVDKGRLRLFQALLQFAGGWAAATALGPFTEGLARKLRQIFCKLSGLFRKAGGFLTAHFRKRRPSAAKKKEKTGRKGKKPQKKT